MNFLKSEVHLIIEFGSSLVSDLKVSFVYTTVWISSDILDVWKITMLLCWSVQKKLIMNLTPTLSGSDIVYAVAMATAQQLCF